MYILTDFNNVVIAQSKTFAAQEKTNYPMVDNGQLIYMMTDYNVYEVEETLIPAERPLSKYCYTKEKGFYNNVDYVDSTEQQVQEAIDNYTMQLIEEGVL